MGPLTIHPLSGKPKDLKAWSVNLFIQSQNPCENLFFLKTNKPKKPFGWI